MKRLLTFLLISIITISSIYAKPKKKSQSKYHPNYSNEYLLNRCREHAHTLGYDESAISEAYYITLPEKMIAKCSKTDDKIIIFVDRNYQFAGWWEFEETLVHEVCHVYTINFVDWHIEMSKAAEKLWWLEPDILADEARQHPLQ